MTDQTDPQDAARNKRMQKEIELRDSIIDKAKRLYLLAKDRWPVEPNEDDWTECQCACLSISYTINRIEDLLIYQQQRAEANYAAEEQNGQASGRASTGNRVAAE